MKVFPSSGSVVVKLPTTVLIAWFSAIVLLFKVMLVGAWLVGVSLTSVTPIVNCFSKDNPPWSVVLTLML